MRPTTSRIVTFAAISVFAACGDDPVEPGGRVASLVPVASTSFIAKAGARVPEELVVRALDDAGEPVMGARVAWEVGDRGGLVSAASTRTDALGEAAVAYTTGTSAGENVVIARIGPETGVRFVVGVVAAQAAGIEASEDTVRLSLGESRLLNATAVDAYGNERGRMMVKWYGDTIAHAEYETGLVTATAVGTGLVQARLWPGQGEWRDTVWVVVTADARSVEVMPDTFALVVGDSASLGAVVRDTSGDEVAAAVQWSSSDPSVLAVDAAGGIRGVAPGMAVVQATSGGVTEKVPVRVHAAFTGAIAAGRGRLGGCALDAQRAAYCWGDTEILGAAPQEPAICLTPDAGRWQDCSAVPVPVAGGLAFDTIVVGGVSACGLTPEGGVYCWAEGAPPASRMPHVRFVQISLAGMFCGLTAAGDAYCEVDGMAPVEAPVPFVVVDDGSWHACGLDADGRAFCWGGGDQGQLGQPATVDTSAALPVQTDLRFASIHAGTNRTCALTADGTAYCWGIRADGTNQCRVGHHGTTQCALLPIVLPQSAPYRDWADSCGLLADGTLECWDLGGCVTINYSGYPNEPCGPVPLESTLVGTNTYVSIDGSCGLTAAGEIRCWGTNDHGQLGTGWASDDRTRADAAPVAAPVGH